MWKKSTQITLQSQNTTAMILPADSNVFNILGASENSMYRSQTFAQDRVSLPILCIYLKKNFLVSPSLPLGI
jgi:hypothetical protein